MLRLLNFFPWSWLFLVRSHTTQPRKPKKKTFLFFPNLRRRPTYPVGWRKPKRMLGGEARAQQYLPVTWREKWLFLVRRGWEGAFPLNTALLPLVISTSHHWSSEHFVRYGLREEQSSSEREVFVQLLLKKLLSTTGHQGAARSLEKKAFPLSFQVTVATPPSDSAEGRVDLRLLLCKARHLDNSSYLKSYSTRAILPVKRQHKDYSTWWEIRDLPRLHNKAKQFRNFGFFFWKWSREIKAEP